MKSTRVAISRFQRADTTSWWLYDMQGRLLGLGELADTQAVIDFSDKTTGEYVLKITNEVGSRSVLIIKK